MLKKTNSGKKPQRRTYGTHKEDVENWVLKGIKNWETQGIIHF